MSSALPRHAQPVPAIAHGYPRLYANLEQLLEAPDPGFEAGFMAFVRELETVFHAEERWLEAAAQGACKEHRELHAEVLSLLHQAQARGFEGDYALARKVIQLLPAWFGDHRPYMGQPLENPGLAQREALRDEV
jgi:hemerythrin